MIGAIRSISYSGSMRLIAIDDTKPRPVMGLHSFLSTKADEPMAMAHLFYYAASNHSLLVFDLPSVL